MLLYLYSKSCGDSQLLLTLPETDKSVYTLCTYHFIALGDFDVKAEVNV